MPAKRLLPLLLALAALSACEPESHELTLVTPLAPVNRDIVEDLHALFGNEHVLTKLTLTEEALSEEDAIQAVIAGTADLALVPNSLDYRPDIASIMPLYSTVLHIAQREQANLQGDRELAVYAGSEGSVSRRMFERVAERADHQFNNYRFVVDASETVDIVVIFAPISPQRAAEIPGMVLWSVERPENLGQGGLVDAAVLLNPHFRPFVIPAGTYGDATPEPVVTIAVDQLLVTRSDMDAAVVYDLINDLLRLRPALASRRPGLFHHLTGDFDASRSRLMLHAGAQNYLQREEPTVYERYSGVAEVMVTLLIACFSATLASVRIYQRRRKNRIDEFYSRTIELQRSVTASSTAEERARVIDELRSLQVKAFDMLVDEKLAADESFRIFITLSNDVLRQLGEDSAIS